MRGKRIAAAGIVALGLVAGPAAAGDVVVGGLAFQIDPRVWRVDGDRLVCRTEGCEGAVVRVRRSTATCDDALLAATARDHVGRDHAAVRILPARDLFVRFMAVPSPCRNWAADPIVACVAVGDTTRILTTADDRGRVCGVPASAKEPILDLIGRVGKP